ncbi:GntR family transcriptional regulator [Shouchella patagoniensis]|uniref:GntR family transcriptional regulator n=1 Tax=Shouchella patagoniensis TaxID=228576 RepID=UPI000994FF90|nr:GntR family transcriptional regulator [Shouchella patagoniensis]
MNNQTKFNVSTREYVYETIRARIMTLKLPPGTAISEKDIAEELNVSRTPVREAFLKLSEDELLHILPQRGSFVTLIDLNHVEDARFMREHTEAAIIKLACSTIDESSLSKMERNVVEQKQAKENDDEELLFELDRTFHLTLAEGTNKVRVWEIVQRMDTHLNRMRKLSMHLKLNWDLLIEQHEAMLNAIKAKNVLEAEIVMHAHLTLLQYDQSALKDEYPHYFQQ